MEYMICAFVFILVIVIIIITLTKNKKSPFANKEKFADEMSTSGSTSGTTNSNIKTLKYFGGGYCPYSNKNSNAYKVIKDFEEYIKSKDSVEIKYYWTEENPAEMDSYKIIYVPTILGNNNQPIELKLPVGTDTSNKTDSELKSLLMDYIYNSL